MISGKRATLARMSESRGHRGPAPNDEVLFAEVTWPALKTATLELSWLLSRGYVMLSGLKLVGDRHALTARQRAAVERAACAAEVAQGRRQKRVSIDALRGQVVAIDAFNVLIVSESAFSNAPIFRGQDGALRDLGGVHGSWRRVQETEPVLLALAALLRDAEVARVRFFIDRPVSNSGRLRALIDEVFSHAAPSLPLEIELVPSADPSLREEHDAIIASADGWVIDGSTRWIDLPSVLVEEREQAIWLVDLSDMSAATPSPSSAKPC